MLKVGASWRSQNASHSFGKSRSKKGGIKKESPPPAHAGVTLDARHSGAVIVPLCKKILLYWWVANTVLIKWNQFGGEGHRGRTKCLSAALREQTPLVVFLKLLRIWAIIRGMRDERGQRRVLAADFNFMSQWDSIEEIKHCWHVKSKPDSVGCISGIQTARVSLSFWWHTGEICRRALNGRLIHTCSHS